MLKTRNLTFAYKDGKKFTFPDIFCEKGETCLILGRSGVGKTTLLHLLAGLLHPGSGNITLDEYDMGQIRDSEMDRFRGQHIGIVFQKPHFISSISILSNLLLTQQLAGIKEDKTLIYKILDHLHIAERATSKPASLSQGELQRAAVARAILNKPALILADEPTSALDDVSCKQVLDVLREEARSLNAALLIVTHDSRLKDIVDQKIILS